MWKIGSNGWMVVSNTLNRPPTYGARASPKHFVITPLLQIASTYYVATSNYSPVGWQGADIGLLIASLIFAIALP
jgi:hypothetical protein